MNRNFIDIKANLVNKIEQFKVMLIYLKSKNGSAKALIVKNPLLEKLVSKANFTKSKN